MERAFIEKKRVLGQEAFLVTIGDERVAFDKIEDALLRVGLYFDGNKAKEEHRAAQWKSPGTRSFTVKRRYKPRDPTRYLAKYGNSARGIVRQLIDSSPRPLSTGEVRTALSRKGIVMPLGTIYSNLWELRKIGQLKQDHHGKWAKL